MTTRSPFHRLSVAAFILLLGISRTVSAQDTVAVTLDQAEELFAKNNLRLLAAKFSIDASRSLVMQAGLWNNPNLSIDQNIYNPETHKYFDVTATGNTGIQLQQLFLLAGKRGKQVALAEANASIAGYTFSEVLRSLLYQLRSDFYRVYYLRQSLAFYDESIAYIQRTVDVTERLREKRTILPSEVMRLKSLLFSLQKERLGLQNDLDERVFDLRILLSDSATSNTIFNPLVDAAKLDSVTLDGITVRAAVAAALDHRPDYKAAEQSVLAEEANLSLQKALAVPDLTVGGNWSRAGNYIPNYFGLTLSLDLPIFNRNQGNIEASEYTLEANKRLKENTRHTIEKEVTTAYQRAAEIEKLYRAFNKRFPEEYRQLVTGMTENYERRNIGIIEFTDFFESYRNSIVQFHQLENDRVEALAGLNLAVGTLLVKF